MTLPYERKTAVLNTERFLKDLMDPKKTPRVPKAIRESAMHLLRHYPNRLYMDAAARYAPEVFGEYKSKWECPIGDPDCKSNCGNYGCGN